MEGIDYIKLKKFELLNWEFLNFESIFKTCENSENLYKVSPNIILEGDTLKVANALNFVRAKVTANLEILGHMDLDKAAVKQIIDNIWLD